MEKKRLCSARIIKSLKMFHSLLLVACTMLSQAAVVHTARLYHNAKYSSIRFNHWKRCISVATGAGDDLSCPDQGEGPINVDTGDLLLTGLNGAQDISVKVVSCREGRAIDDLLPHHHRYG